LIILFSLALENPKNENKMSEETTDAVADTGKQGKGKAMFGMILSIVGFIASWGVTVFYLISPILAYIFVAISAIGLILSFMGLKQNKGMSIVGIILGLIGILVGIMMLMAGMKAAEYEVDPDKFKSSFEDFGNDFGNALKDGIEDGLNGDGE
jgi:hypothetical protein